VIEKGNELEQKLHKRWLMIAGEGMVFFVLLLSGFILVRNTFKKESALVQQQKNFLHSITHELKSPIASAKLQLETLLKRDLTQEKQNELLLNALHDTERLNHLVENILLAALVENNTFQLQREEVNLSEYLDKFLRQTIQKLSPKQKIEYNIQSNIFFSIDKASFPSIILNLLDNAIKYSDENSTIKIILSEKRNKILLSVSDEGVGIPEKEEENIFKKFYRIGNEETRTTKGTGLGLYIVKELVEKHNGTITVKNNIPKGTVFEIMFK
jgi:K+-sensing histidine kinase KdpD